MLLTHLKTIGVIAAIFLALIIIMLLVVATKGFIIIGAIICFVFSIFYKAIYDCVKETEEEIAQQKRMQKGKED